MKASELRASILQEAVSGRLVPQDPSEGTAEDLLKEIAKERESLIKVGKIKKEKPLPEITEDKYPFEIPKTWKWVRLGEISIKLTDGTHNSPPNGISGDYKYVTAKNISDFGIDTDNITYISKDIHREIYSRCNPKKGDILFIKDGATTGVVTINNLDEEFSLLSSVALIKPSKYILAKYLMYYIRSPFFQFYIKEDMSGTAITRVTLVKLSNAPIIIPPLSEQKRIVAKIEELMPLINEYGKEEGKLSLINSKFPEDIRKSILQEAVSGRLVPQDPSEGTAEDLLKEIAKERESLVKAGKIKKEKPLPEITEDEIPFEIPKTWEWVRLGETAVINPRNQLDDTLSVSFIPMPLINDGYTNKHSSDKRIWKDVKKGFTHLKNGDLGIAKITPCFQNRKSVIFRNLTNGYGAGTTELHVLRFFSDLIYPLYVLWFVKCQYFISRGMDNFTGTAGQERVGTEILSKTLIPIPPLAEQKRIVAKIEELMKIIEKNQF